MRGRGSAPAARPLQTRQRSGLGLSKSGLERCSSYSKRRRNEYDVADILMSDAKYVERPKVRSLASALPAPSPPVCHTSPICVEDISVLRTLSLRLSRSKLP